MHNKADIQPQLRDQRWPIPNTIISNSGRTHHERVAPQFEIIGTVKSSREPAIRLSQGEFASAIIRSGRRIELNIDPGRSSRAQQSELLRLSYAAQIYQLGQVALNASCVRHSTTHRAILLSSDQGDLAAQTTSALQRRQWQILARGISHVSNCDAPQVWPGFVGEPGPPVTSEDIHAANDGPRPSATALSALVVLGESDDDSHVSVEELTGHAAQDEVDARLVLRPVAEQLEPDPTARGSARIARGCRVLRLDLPAHFSSPMIAEQVERAVLRGMI